MAKPAKGVGGSSTLALYLLATMAALGPLPVDMYLPVVGTMSAQFGATPTQSATSISIYFVGMAIGQIFLGPLSDRYGRRPLLMFGLTSTALGALICLIANGLPVFFIGRGFQSLGAASILVTARAAIRDRLDEDKSASFFSTMSTFSSLAVIAAPTVGAALLGSFGWRSVFAFMLAATLAVAIPSYFSVKESHHERKARSQAQAAKTFLDLLCNRPFMGFVMCSAFNGAAYFAFLSLSPLILMESYRLSPTNFGFVMSFNGVALVIATQLNRILLRHWTARQLLNGVCAVAAVLAMCLIAWQVTQIGGVWGLIALCYIATFTGGFAVPNTMAAGMSFSKGELGSAAALFGSLMFVAGTVSSLIGSAFFDGSAVSLVVIMSSALLGMGLSLWLLTKRGRH
jgi:MFS transporter, DHA1 family, multidrug resistance protein